MARYFLLGDGLNRLAIRGEKCSNKSARRALYPSLRRLAMRRRAPALETPVAMGRHLSFLGLLDLALLDFYHRAEDLSQAVHQNVVYCLAPEFVSACAGGAS